MTTKYQDLDNGEPVGAPSLLSQLIAQRQATAPRPVAKPRMGAGTRVALGVVLVVFGLLQWIPAARFTVDGWTAFANLFLTWLGFGAALPRFSALPLIGAMLTIGGLYSWVETKCMPVQRIGDAWQFMGLMALVGWLFLTATDVGSTYVGMTAVTSSTPRILRDLAAQPSIAALVSFYLTFAPDWFIIGGMYLMGLGPVLRWLGRIFVRR